MYFSCCFIRSPTPPARPHVFHSYLPTVCADRHKKDKSSCDPLSHLWLKKVTEEQSKPSTLLSLSLRSFLFVSIFLRHLPLLPSCSPPHNLTLPLRAARLRAVLYFFAHFSQRLVPSHADPYHALVQSRQWWRKRVIFSPWVRTPHDKW